MSGLSLLIGTEAGRGCTQACVGVYIVCGGGAKDFPLPEVPHPFPGMIGLAPGHGWDQVPTLLGYEHCGKEWHL